MRKRGRNRKRMMQGLKNILSVDEFRMIAGLPPIKFDFSELFVTATFYRSGLMAESGTESGLSRDQVKILNNCLNEVTILELMEIFDRTNRTKFRDQVIKPLIDAGWIEMTIPDKPTSSKQKYRITEKGRQLLQNAR
jgi:predicted transcriptional regulator